MGEQEQPEAPDTRGPAIVIAGSLLSGMKFYGPFESIKAAIDWYGTSLYGIVNDKVTITLLEDPAAKKPE